MVALTPSRPTPRTVSSAVRNKAVAAGSGRWLRDLPDHVAEPSVQTAAKRYLTHVRAAIERLRQLDGSS